MSKTVDVRIGDIEELLDGFARSDYRKPFNVYDYLKLTDCTWSHARAVAEYYRPVLAEAMELLAGDPSLREGYRGMNKPQISKRVDQLKSIVEAAERFAQNLKASKPRKAVLRKEKSAEQLVKTFTSKADDTELKLASVPAAQIVGSRITYLYSTRYKIIQALVAPDGGSLTVSGSTVKGFDEKASCAKTIRKPEEFFSKFMAMGWKSQLELVQSLKTKAQEATGRSNKDTIVVKAVRNNG